jgi:hypothetical protein
MPAPSEKLAASLEILHALQNPNGAGAIRARDLSHTHRERLVANEHLRPRKSDVPETLYVDLGVMRGCIEMPVAQYGPNLFESGALP